MAKRTTKELDEGQLEYMWNFLKMGGGMKPNIGELKHFLDLLRQAMIQKSAGQEGYSKSGDTDFKDLGTIINVIVIETMALYLSGGLDKIEEALEKDSSD